MKTPLFRQFALVALALGLGSLNVKAVDPNNPNLPEILALKRNRAVVFQPFTIKPGQTLRATYLQLGPGGGPHRGVRLLIFKSALTDGTHQLIGDSGVIPLDRSKDPVTTLEYTHPGGANAESNGIIAVLIGLLLPAVQTGDQTPQVMPLFPPDSISAELIDPGTGIGLLVPAVQKVREAAAR